MKPAAALPSRPRGRPARDETRYADTRAVLVKRGVELLTERGMAATSLEDVLKSTGVPKGSFYYYFADKQAFVQASVEAYAQYFAHKLDRHFGDGGRSVRERLQAFVEDACRGMRRHAFRRGCLVGNLGQEVAVLAPELRGHLEAVFQEWERRLAACLASGVERGELAADTDCAGLAHVFWIGWEGAVLRARLVGSVAPMRAFFQLFDAVLR